MIEVHFWWRERPDAPAIGAITLDTTDDGQERLRFAGGRTELEAVAATEVVAHPDPFHEFRVPLDSDVPAFWLRAIPEALDATEAPVRAEVTHDDHMDPDDLMVLLGTDPDSLEIADDWDEDDDSSDSPRSM